MAVVSNLVAVGLIVFTAMAFNHYRKINQTQIILLHHRNDALEYQIRLLKQRTDMQQPFMDRHYQ